MENDASHVALLAPKVAAAAENWYTDGKAVCMGVHRVRPDAQCTLPFFIIWRKCDGGTKPVWGEGGHGTPVPPPLDDGPDSLWYREFQAVARSPS